MKNRKLKYAIENLNLDDLDVQGLEARLELAVAAPAASSGCRDKLACDDCPGVCLAYCSTGSSCYADSW